MFNRNKIKELKAKITNLKDYINRLEDQYLRNSEVIEYKDAEIDRLEKELLRSEEALKTIEEFLNLTLKIDVIKVSNIKPSLEEAMKVLCNELKNKDYYRSWSANIAMAFYDEFSRIDTNLVVDHLKVHIIANKAADNFLKQLMK